MQRSLGSEGLSAPVDQCPFSANQARAAARSRPRTCPKCRWPPMIQASISGATTMAFAPPAQSSVQLPSRCLPGSAPANGGSPHPCVIEDQQSVPEPGTLVPEDLGAVGACASVRTPCEVAHVRVEPSRKPQALVAEQDGLQRRDPHGVGAKNDEVPHSSCQGTRTAFPDRCPLRHARSSGCSAPGTAVVEPVSRIEKQSRSFGSTMPTKTGEWVATMIWIRTGCRSAW